MIAFFFVILQSYAENQGFQVSDVPGGAATIIGAVAGLIGGGAWIGNYLTTRQKNNQEYSVKMRELDTQLEETEKQRLTNYIEKLEAQLEDLKNELETEREEHERYVKQQKQEAEKRNLEHEERVKRMEQKLYALGLNWDLLVMTIKKQTPDHTYIEELEKIMKSHGMGSHGNTTSTKT